jgi:LacI family transcriptional regulator
MQNSAQKKAQKGRTRGRAARPTVTLLDIAENLGVDRSTVSICLSGSPRAEKFSEAMRLRVRAEALRLNYRPDFFASQLRKGQRKICLLGLGSIEDPHAGAIADSFIQRMTRERHLVVATTMQQKAPTPESEPDQLLATNLVNSICMVTNALDASPPDWVEKLVKRGVHVVLIGRRSAQSEVIQVYCDEKASGRQAVRHLAAQGYRRIGIVCDALEPNHPLYPRHLGAIEEAKKLGLAKPKILKLVKDRDLLYEAAKKSIQKWLKKHPELDGIFAIRDALAYATAQAASCHGLAIGPQLGIIGHDDLWTSRLFNPALTSIRQPMSQMGLTAAELLLDRLSGTAKQTSKKFPTEVIVRDTTTRA